MSTSGDSTLHVVQGRILINQDVQQTPIQKRGIATYEAKSLCLFFAKLFHRTVCIKVGDTSFIVNKESAKKFLQRHNLRDYDTLQQGVDIVIPSLQLQGGGEGLQRMQEEDRQAIYEAIGQIAQKHRSMVSMIGKELPVQQRKEFIVELKKSLACVAESDQTAILTTLQQIPKEKRLQFVQQVAQWVSSSGGISADILNLLLQVEQASSRTCILDVLPQVPKAEQLEFVRVVTELCKLGKWSITENTIDIINIIKRCSAVEREAIVRQVKQLLDCQQPDIVRDIAQSLEMITKIPQNRRQEVVNVAEELIKEALKPIFEKGFGSYQVGNGTRLLFLKTIEQSEQGQERVVAQVAKKLEPPLLLQEGARGAGVSGPMIDRALAGVERAVILIRKRIINPDGTIPQENLEIVDRVQKLESWKSEKHITQEIESGFTS